MTNPPVHGGSATTGLADLPEVAGDELARANAAGIDPENTGLAILRAVRGYGVDTVFGIPGTHNLEFYRHLPRLGMRPITTRHEQGAGYAADAWAQRTGLPGVILTTSGPGLLNTLSAAGVAYCESRPMLILAPGTPRGSEGHETGMLHETKDQLGAAASVVTRALRPETAAEAVDAVHEAFALFASGRPRPVYLEVPLDLLEAAHEIPPDQLMPRTFPSPSVPSPEDVEAAAAIVAGAERPALLIGAGARGARAELTALAEHLGAPVVTSSNGKGVIRESHPLVIGAELRLAAAIDVLNHADVLIVVGTKAAVGELAGAELSPRGRVIRIDIDTTQGQKNIDAEKVLVGDAAAIVPALARALHADATDSAAAVASAPARQPWLDLDAVRADCRTEAAAYGAGIDVLAERIAAALPANTILTGDSSQISYAGMASRFRAEEPATCLNMITYATLGYGLPAALGAKLASPEHTAVCVTGDGALMFSVPELQTATEHDIDVTVLCVDNGGYGEIEQNEIDRGIAPIGVRLSQPRWPLVAEAFGGRGFSVTAADELEDTIAEAIAHPGASLVHIPMGLFT